MNKILKLSAYGLCISLWFFTGCSSGDDPEPFDCDKSDLIIVLDNVLDVSSCTSTDGLIEVSATGGMEPYQFKLDNGSFQSVGLFNTGISGGTHIVTVKDKNACEVTLDVEVGITGSTLSATKVEVPDTECVDDIGSVTITASGGTPPYEITMGTTALDTNPATFSGLAPGTYDISVSDAAGCEFPVRASVGKGPTGITYTLNIKPIFEQKCNFSGCHPANGDWLTYSVAKGKASLIKTTTGNGSMPKDPKPGGALTSSQKAMIACWVDDGAPE